MQKVSTIILVVLTVVATSFQSLNAQCTAPVGLGATSADATTMNLFWSAVAGATSYDINVQNGPGNPVFMDATTNNIPGTTFLATGLVSGSNYKFKVRTDCGGDHSGWSPYYFFTAGGGVGGDSCGTPVGLVATEITSSGATLTWTAAPGAINYRIRVEDGSGNPIEFAFTGMSATTSFNITGLNAASNYKFKVRTRCASGHSGWSAWTNFTTAPLRVTDQVDANLFIYPNPATSEIHINMNDVYASSHLMIIDLSGKVIYEQNAIETNHISISTADFANGIYQLVIVSNDKVTTKQFSVVH